jgi:isocitrate dehydrogenase kinase/phosphatase
MPRKRIAELYTSIGHNKHGKTELYRDMLHHLASTEDKFEIARGQRGMVMVVFTMPSYDVVFKLIKDRFDYPKTTTRREVMAQYHLVFQHDRVGRLIDAQEFEHLKFDRKYFSEELLEELLQVAPSIVKLEDDYVVIRHAYVERRVTPLDIFLCEEDEVHSYPAVLDFGNTIKDLAAVNIFPGDMLLKNFGVTRHGRVVFYDYDELAWLSECHFREVPKSDNYDDELSAEPWFSIGENDVFPEEFHRFIGLNGPLRQLFIEQHGDLLGINFWKQMQTRLNNGEIIEILPYQENKRLHHKSLAKNLLR